MELSETFKETLSSRPRFVTFSLSVTMLEKCMDIFCRYGVSPETMSFFSEGLSRLSTELEKGYEYIRIKQDFERIMGQLDDPPPAP